MKKYANQLIIPLKKQSGCKECSSAGRKGLNLLELVQYNMPVKPGFIVTIPAYFYFLEHNHLKLKINDIIGQMKVVNVANLKATRDKIYKLFLTAEFPEDLKRDILKNYADLQKNKQQYVAIRSSVSIEKYPDEVFAGRLNSFMNQIGEQQIFDSIRKVWASLFDVKSLFYRYEKGIDNFDIASAVIIQAMVQSEASGVLFTINPNNGDQSVAVIESVWGLGELLAQGMVNPDIVYVDPRNGRIIKTDNGKQKLQMTKVGKLTKLRPVPKRLQSASKLSPKLIKKLVDLGTKLEQSYKWPQVIEWGLEKNRLWIFQSQPLEITEEVNIKENNYHTYLEDNKSQILLRGLPAEKGIVSGVVKIINNLKDLDKVKRNEIAVAHNLEPDYLPAMRKVAAIITEIGCQSSHAAIIARELGIPCIIGAKQATQKLSEGRTITVDADKGIIYADKVKVKKQHLLLPKGVSKISDLKTDTKVLLDFSYSQAAYTASLTDNDGVGVIDGSFLVQEYLIKHPKKLLQEKRKNFIVAKLSESIEMFARMFAPKDVVYRLSSLTQADYLQMDQGAKYETEEDCAEFGNRGVSRLLQDKDLLDLELSMLKVVRKKYDWQNVSLQLPFVRTLDEFKQIKKYLAKYDLKRSNKFKLYISVDVPNVMFWLDDAVKAGVDGIYVNIDNLAKSLLGYFPYSDQNSVNYSLLDPGLIKFIQALNLLAKKLKIEVIFGGNALSAYPKLLAKILEMKVDAVCVTPDMVELARLIAYKISKKISF